MSAESALRAGRKAHERLMRSTCIIGRPNGTERNPATGQLEDKLETVYDGRCLFHLPGDSSSGADVQNAQGQPLTLQQPNLRLPIAGTDDVQLGDIVIITANPLDVALVGTRARITEAHSQTYATARRFPVEVIARG